jgi:hypothetical protein
MPSAQQCSRWRPHERTAWRYRLRAEVVSLPESSDPDVARAYASAIPLRCPRALIIGGLRRVPGLRSPEGVSALHAGEAFVSEASGLTGGPRSPLLNWDLKYLKRHLPVEMKWPVFRAGTSKIVMTHTNRNLTSAELAELERRGGRPTLDARFRPVSQTMMTFDDFLEATREHERCVANGQPSDPPYLGSDVLWRNSMEDNGNIQNIGERLKADLLGGANFASLKALMDAGDLPLMKQVHLFVGSARTLYHCHYDLQPNLHVQLVGSKRFIVFPPDEHAKLHPFPVYHDYDRRSQVRATRSAHHLPNLYPLLPTCHCHGHAFRRSIWTI